MEAILKTNNYSENYELVQVVKNPISETNKLALIINSNGEEEWTGGILVEKDENTMRVLNSLTPVEQWDWLYKIRRKVIVR